MHVCMYVYKLIYNILILYVYVLYIVRHQVVNPKAVHIMYVYMYVCNIMERTFLVECRTYFS